MLAVGLNLVALFFSTTAFITTYWCEGTQKVPKPNCNKVTKLNCINLNGSGAVNSSNSNLPQYSWDTGDDKFFFRYFHTGIWYSCEENINGIGECDKTTRGLSIAFLCFKRVSVGVVGSSGGSPPETSVRNIVHFKKDVTERNKTTHFNCLQTAALCDKNVLNSVSLGRFLSNSETTLKLKKVEGLY